MIAGHKSNFALPAELADSSITSIVPPVVNPACGAGSLVIFFESV